MLFLVNNATQWRVCLRIAIVSHQLCSHSIAYTSLGRVPPKRLRDVAWRFDVTRRSLGSLLLHYMSVKINTWKREDST